MDKGECVDAGWALCYCKWWWVMDRRGWVHTIHSAPCGSLHFHTCTVCLSDTDNAGTYALPWASKAVFCQATASWAHACPTYHRGAPSNTCLHGLQRQTVRSWHHGKMHGAQSILESHCKCRNNTLLPYFSCMYPLHYKKKSHLLILNITCTMLNMCIHFTTLYENKVPFGFVLDLVTYWRCCFEKKKKCAHYHKKK